MDGKDILFVSNPGEANKEGAAVYAHPDDVADKGRRWKEELLRYNTTPSNNYLGLLPAWKFYNRTIFTQLYESPDIDLFILSAGWGLLSADFLIPNYDIAFGPQADPYERRGNKDTFDDLCMLPLNSEEPIIFFVGKAYLPMAYGLTHRAKAPRYVFYNSKSPPELPGFNLRLYETEVRTNWHYECAKDFLAGKVTI